MKKRKQFEPVVETDLKKYELTEEQKVLSLPTRDATLHRIRAVLDFFTVCAGDYGGWVESEYNLSQEGDCWIFDEAMAFDEARVFGNAKVRHEAAVYEHARIADNARIYNHAKVYGMATVRFHAKVCDCAVVRGTTQVLAFARIGGAVVIGGNSYISGHVSLYCEETTSDQPLLY
jgi:hypothetical protein